MGLTVAEVAGVNAALQSFRLRELGEHLRQGAALLTRRSAGLLHPVVPFWELQRQIPERLHRVRLALAGQTRYLQGHRKFSLETWTIAGKSDT